MMNCIEIQNISISFAQTQKRKVSFRDFLVSTVTNKNSGLFKALNNVSFNVAYGEVIGVIGHNGAGKSTLLRMIGGIYMPDQGDVRVRGVVSTLLSLGTGFQPELNGIDNIYMNALLMNFPKERVDAIIDDIISFSELEKFIYNPIKTYSSGMLARLGFSIAVHMDCDIMLVDEILGVGDKDFRHKSTNKIKEIMAQDRTAVIVSHNLEDIATYASRVLWLDGGQIRALGPTSVVLDEYVRSKPVDASAR